MQLHSTVALQAVSLRDLEWCCMSTPVDSSLEKTIPLGARSIRTRLPSFNTVVNVLLAAACLVVIAKTSHEWLNRPSIPRQAAFRVGEKIDGLNGVTWQKRNVVLFARSTCRYCTESMTLYKELSDLAQRSDVQFIAVGDEPVETLRAYFTTYGVRLEAVIAVRVAETGSFATPTLAVTDENGRIVQSWVGRIPKTDEKNVTSHLRRDQG
jgi:peroxiredoxin